jgi:hypothetical protein
MKKLLKTLLSTLGILLLLIVVILIWALQKVDYTPYWETDYYATTRARLDSLSGNLTPQRGKVYAGFSRMSITPRLHATSDDPGKGAFKAVPLAGFGDREGRPAEGIHDSLFIKAVALRVGIDTLVLLASDILIVPAEVSEGVTQQLAATRRMRRDQLLFSATHTHSSAGGWADKYVGKEFAGDYDTAVVQWLIQQYTRAVVTALADMRPAALGSGTFAAPAYVKNRLIGDKGFKNGQFAWLVIKQDEGRTAVLGSFAGHPTTLGGWNMLFSGDYPGYWQRSMEGQGYDLALFFAGPVGSHSVRSKGEKFEKPKYVGETLADSTLHHCRGAVLQDTLTLTALTLPVTLPQFHVRVTDHLRLRPSLVKKLFPPVGRVYLQTARLGNMIWITAPCDFSGELALGYQAAAEAEGLHAMVTSFNGSYIGYVIPGKYYHLNEYESRLMSWFGPYTGPWFDEMIRRMENRMIAKN